MSSEYTIPPEFERGRVFLDLYWRKGMKLREWSFHPQLFVEWDQSIVLIPTILFAPPDIRNFQTSESCEISIGWLGFWITLGCIVRNRDAYRKQ